MNRLACFVFALLAFSQLYTMSNAGIGVQLGGIVDNLGNTVFSPIGGVPNIPPTTSNPVSSSSPGVVPVSSPPVSNATSGVAAPANLNATSGIIPAVDPVSTLPVSNATSGVVPSVG